MFKKAVFESEFCSEKLHVIWVTGSCSPQAFGSEEKNTIKGRYSVQEI